MKMDPPNHPGKTGSALLVTLLVMGLMTMLVLAFSTHVRLELRSISNHQNQHLARANARLGLELALAQLQAAAGPDQRVTARAEILGEDAANPNAKFWTGVWENDGQGGVRTTPTWLVSGNSPNPLSSGTSTLISVFPATASEEPVQVPVVPIHPSSTAQQGEYAYWIADEGVKASAVARRGAIPLYEHATQNTARRGVEYQSDFGVDLSPFFSSPNFNLTDTELSMRLDRVNSNKDLLMVSDSLGHLLTASNTILDHAHELTPLAMGVLENPADGGLKKNLSDPNVRDTFLATEELQRFLEPKGNELIVDVQSPADRGVLEGRPFFGPRPLLTEAVIYMGIFHTWSDAKLRIRYHFEAEFLNPYSIPLQFPADNHGSYNRGLVLYLENLPTLTVRDLTPSTLVPEITEDLNQLSAYTTNDTRRYINSWFEISPYSTPNVPQLNPGEIYRVIEPNPVTQSRGLARDFGTVRWSGNQNTRPLDTAQIEISSDHPPEGITLKIVPYQNEGNPKDRTPILSFEGLFFDNFTIEKTFRSGPNPFSRSDSSSYTQQDYTIAYHFRIGSDATDLASMRDILTSVDLRDPEFSSSETFSDMQGNTISKADLLDPIYTDPSFIVTDDSNLFSELDQLTDGTSRSHTPDFIRTILYDIPNGDTLSVGQLSSLHIYKRAPRSIGNPWGGEYNLAFDRYYFSPRIIHPVYNSNISANPAMINVSEPDIASPLENYAPYEMTIGQFNLNSTSVAAWEAVLAAPILTPTAVDEAGDSDLARAATFLRLPVHQSKNYDFFVSKEELQKPENIFAQGLRALDGSEGRAQLRELAENIVKNLKTRAEPFSSLQEFVNSGLLQNSIDEVGQNAATTGIPPINQGLFEYSNIYLTQSDLLTKLAPYASIRADTFKIRTFGSVIDSNGVQISTARCEAIVQRLPQKIDGSDPMTPSTDILDMRTFKITSFRWLNDEEF
jgi:Tfp pilus assembly protein PilX